MPTGARPSLPFLPFFPVYQDHSCHSDHSSHSHSCHSCRSCHFYSDHSFHYTHSLYSPLAKGRITAIFYWLISRKHGDVIFAFEGGGDRYRCPGSDGLASQQPSHSELQRIQCKIHKIHVEPGVCNHGGYQRRPKLDGPCRSEQWAHKRKRRRLQTIQSEALPCQAGRLSYNMCWGEEDEVHRIMRRLTPHGFVTLILLIIFGPRVVLYAFNVATASFAYTIRVASHLIEKVDQVGPPDFELPTISHSTLSHPGNQAPATTYTYSPDPISWGLDMEDCLSDLRMSRNLQDVTFR